ncbi:MAG: divergent polysaccharide deacetylase family protein [Alteromonadaceae bacterium]
MNLFPRLFILLALVSIVAPAMAKNAQVAIIIDDIGYRQSDAAALTLPGAITFAILPHTPYGKTLALQADRKDHDVILHIPMEAENGKKLGPGGLTIQMNEQSIRHELALAFEEIPFAIGINNHMGSKLTKLYTPMMWTMRFLKERNLIFVDSVTTKKTQGERIALKLGVPTAHRQIFLDNVLTNDYIEQQFRQLIQHAQQFKSGVAIAHPHPETIAALNRLIPLLAELDIDLVPISTLIDSPKKRQAYTEISDE